VGKSFQLIRTNPRLTTNYKIVVSSDYDMYLESFDSSKDLSDDRYKHYLLSIDSVLENDMPKFYAGLPKNIAFSPKSEHDVDVMYDTYNNQFDETYYAGADEVEDTWYKEEFEYFAPLYVIKNELPSNFIIMRIDDANIYEKTGSDYTISTLNKDNFRDEIIDKWKCTNVYDLSNETAIGKFFDRNINDNTRFPDYSFFFDTKKYNYSKWAGLEYKSGVYRTAELFLDGKLNFENPHFNLEEYITKGFEENGIIYPYIMNLKFLFDDSPATPTEFKKWSMNRYYGFYTNDLELVKTITSYELPDLKSNLTIKNNIFLDGSGNFVNPFVSEYIKNDWVQVGLEFYEVRQQTNGSFKIISDENLTGENTSTFNTGFVIIANNTISDFGTIDQFISPNNLDENMYADLYLIEINGSHHVLKNDYTKTYGVSGETIFHNNYTIQTDYSISSNGDILEYYKGGRDNDFHVLKEITTESGRPLSYNIYRVKLADVKDFDFDRIHTSYSDFDYEKSDYHSTLEEKLYATEYRDNSVPKRKKLHSLNQDGQYNLMNISSEYTAGDETFELRKNNEINPLWEKNQSICKWGYRGSISHSDYPYKLNNSKEFGGVYNRITNTDTKEANVKQKNLDYFYRIGNFYGAEDVPLMTPEFDSTSLTRWTINDGSWSWYAPNSALVATVGTSTRQITHDTVNLTIGNDYYIYIKFFNVGYFDAGIHPDTFSNMTSNIGYVDIVLEGIRKANGTELKIISDNSSSATSFYELVIYDITNRYYLNQSTNIQTNLFSYLDSSTDDRFNLDYYINSDFDYFDFFFRNIMYYEDYGQLKQKPFLKYATFGGGDGDLPATALFKGVEYKIYNVEDIVLNSPQGTEETIRNVITQGGVNFNGYKMAVILSENYNYYSFGKQTTEIVEEDIVPSDYDSFSDLQVTGGTNSDIGWQQYGDFLQWFWYPEDEDSPHEMSAKLLNSDLILSSEYTYDVTISLSWFVGGESWVGSRIVTANFWCDSFDTAIPSTQLFSIDYEDGPDFTDSTTFTLTDVSLVTNGEIKLEFDWDLQPDTIPFEYGKNYLRITNVNINRKTEGIEYADPVFEYSYNTSINGILDSQDKNGLHVYLNEKHKNALVIINQNIPMNIDWVSMNNIDSFGENHGLYYGETLDHFNMFPVSGTTVNEYNPNDLTAFNYMDALNNLNDKGLFDNFVYYHYIDSEANYAKTQMIKWNNSSFEALPNWDEKFPPFIFEVDGPLDLSLKKNSYYRRALYQPLTNITDKFLVFDNGVPLPQSVINEPLARDIDINERDDKYRYIYHGESIYQDINIKRFVGYYEPLFKTIPMYKPIYYWNDDESYLAVGDNYVFADNLEQFATINELMYSKVNDEYNVLKLKDTDNDKSVYPMVDEIGLSQTDRFIFLSSWDSEFFLKTLNETTFLEEFITTDIEDPTIPVYGQIATIDVTTPDPYWVGINIYGSTLEPTNLGYDLTIKNLSANTQTFDYQMKYISNLSSSGVLYSNTTSALAPNASTIVSIPYARPSEQNFGVPYYEEFTTWKVIFELLDTDGNDLDSNDNTTFDVYNNLINLNLYNPNVTDGFTSIHYVNTLYTYSIDLDETNDRLKNISYTAKLYTEVSGGTDIYYPLSTTSGTITNNTTITFSNINTPIFEGEPYELPYNTTDVRKIKYEVYHEYDIEGDTKITGDTFITVTGMTVSRPPEPSNITWSDPTSQPTFNMVQGTCDYLLEVYGGDTAQNCTATIKNIGGTFNGSVSVTFYWRADAVNIASKTIDWSGILNKNDEHIFLTTIGPTDDITGDPYITFTNKDYTIKASCTQISGSITSVAKVGYNPGVPDCTAP